MPAFAAADCIEEVIVEKGEGGGSGLAGLRERRLILLLLQSNSAAMWLYGKARAATKVRPSCLRLRLA